MSECDCGPCTPEQWRDPSRHTYPCHCKPNGCKHCFHGPEFDIKPVDGEIAFCCKCEVRVVPYEH